MWIVRSLKVAALSMLALAFMTTSVFAGGAACTASKQVSSEKACLSTVFAGAGNHCTASKAKLAELVDIETVRLPSGALVVMYKGKTADAVSYLQAAAGSSVESFCCPVTRNLASNRDAHVEIAKSTQGAVIVVTAEKAGIIDEIQGSYLTLASASTAK
jgi:hypothetical protein